MNKRIMIVDDEPDVLFALRTIFERKNFDVITVKNGFECLNELEKGFKGVILMDIMMPDMDGWDTIKTIVQRGLMKGVAIEIITGKGTKDHEKMAGLESYIRDYLAKPLDTKQLLASVDECNRYLGGKK